ncbi:MAG: carbohydrate kinase family protein [Thermoplasmatota archaeon]
MERSEITHGGRILAVGDMTLDILCSPVSGIPEGDAQLQLEWIRLSPGGNTMNFALAAGALGATVELHASHGGDGLSLFLKEWIRKCGVIDMTFPSDDSGTATTVAIPDTKGSRKLLTYTGANSLMEIGPKHLDLQGVASLHTGGYFFQPAMAEGPIWDILREARGSGVETSMDPATDPGGFEGEAAAKLRDNVHLLDILFVNEEEVRGLTGEGDLEMGIASLIELGAKSVVVHQGSRGSRFISEDEDIQVKASPVKEILNPTGTGDIYNAGFVTARLKGLDITSSMEVGTAAAALHIGTSEPYYPSWKDVQNLLMSEK